MDPDRKRKIRLVVALSAAVLLAAGLVYTSFSASSEAKSPSELVAVRTGGPYQLEGVVDRIISGHESGFRPVRFAVSDVEGSATRRLIVDYEGVRADAFREGREIVVEGSLEKGVFVGEEDTLLTKCPSKFAEEAEGDQNVIVE